MNESARELAAAKRRPETRLGWAVQWGTVRMLGTFLTEDPLAVPGPVVVFMAEQVGVDPECFAEYGGRLQTVYEHAWEIRDVLGYRDFVAGEEQLRLFLAARVQASLEGPRSLFDRAVVWLVEARVLLPSLTTLTRLVASVRAAENARLYRVLHEATPWQVRQDLVGLLGVPQGRRVSELERLRVGPTRLSGRSLSQALDRAAEVAGLGTGGVDVSPVHTAWLAGLARYGMAAKATGLAELEETRKTATLLATVRHLATTSVDDALDLLDLLMSSRLLPRAHRAEQQEKLASLPRVRRAARTLASAVEALLATAPATENGQLVSVAQAWTAIEQVVSREKLSAAVATIGAFVPDAQADGDAAAEWRGQLVARYGTVRGFVRELVEVIDFEAVEAGQAVLEAVRGVPDLIGRKKITAQDIDADLVSGSWRRLVFSNPDLDAGLVDRLAYVMCVLEQLHRALRRRDVYAVGADRWGDPRARLLSGQAWESTSSTVLTALGLHEEPAGHLSELTSALYAAYVQTVDGLPANTAARVEDGRLILDRLGPAAEPPLR